MPANIMRNRANNLISRIEQIKGPRSAFEVNFSRKQTQKASYLYPIFCEEVLPGDTWTINMTAFVRMLTQKVAPIDNLWVKTFFFFDPCRLTWDNFTKQHGERKKPGDHIDYITPIIRAADGFKFKSFYDYLGKTQCGKSNSWITALAPRSHNRIWNAFFRSEQLQDPVPEHTGDEDDPIEDYGLYKIGKMHDYFTDMTPNRQLGEPVKLPIGERANVYGYPDMVGIHITDSDGNATVMNKNSSNNTLGTYNNIIGNSLVKFPTKEQFENVAEFGGHADLYADLSNALAANISAVRFAIDLQELLENDNRFGIRYTENLAMRYNVVNPDLLMYRPQYLGGTATPLFTTPVYQTSGSNITDQTTPQGNVAGYGVTTDSGQVIHQSFGEFGHILGYAVIQAMPQYQQGRGRKFTRLQRYDYMYPEFMGLSDQAVKNGELFYQGDDVVDENGEIVDDKVVGYTGRFDEYRMFTNEICGELRSDYPESLDVWHYAEKFENKPELNDEFIEDFTDEVVKRSLAVQTEDENGEIIDTEQFLVDIQYKGSVVRGLTAYAKPQTGGRIL